MRLVSREEFLKLKPETVYMVPFQESGGVGLYGQLYIKGDTIGLDWYCSSVDDWQYDDNDIESCSLTFASASDRDVPMDYWTQIRHDDPGISVLAVLSDDDVIALCDRLMSTIRKFEG